MIPCKSLTLIDLKRDKTLTINLHLTGFSLIKTKQQFLASKVYPKKLIVSDGLRHYLAKLILNPK